MKRPLTIWLVYAACLAGVLGAMGYVTLRVVRLERAAEDARQHAAAEETVRLALWRLDSTAMPLIALENGMPFHAYMPNEAGPRVALAAEADGAGPFDAVRLRFTVMQDGQFLAGGPDPDAEAELLEVAGPAELLSAARTAPLVRQEQWVVGPTGREQDASNIKEVRARGQARSQWDMANVAVQAGDRVVQQPVEAVWLGGQMLLLRRVRIGERSGVQGAWLDWPVLRESLLDAVADLLGDADLKPRPADAVSWDRAMAALPVELAPGEVAVEPAAAGAGLAWPLSLAWSATLAAACGAAALLHGAMSLSRRRGRFVSAVTHELRTPLTTFRLYSDLLAEDAFDEPEKRRMYLRRLQDEADRLGRLVENVLSYARLDGRAARRVEAVRLDGVLDRCAGRLEERAAQAEMKIRTELTDEASRAIVSVDGEAVEQILMNLVDNACKYAADGDGTIRITADAGRHRATIRVADTGPGIDAGQAKRLFQPFSRSDREAAGSAPGVGLGLALSRQLARRMGAKLRHEPAERGAVFAVEIKRADA